MAGAPATLPAHHGRHKGQLVLGPAAHQLPQKSRPFVAAIPTGTHVTVTLATNRRPSPSAYAINADNASPGAVLAGLGQTDTASGASRTNSPVNRSPIAPADAPNARSQPRTVEAGRPHPAAILRCPHPTANFSSIAAAITSALSTRRTANRTSSSTCVRRHPTHRERRGRQDRPTQSVPRPSRITRARAHPHGRNRPPQPGQATRPSSRSNSTTAAS